MESFIKNLNPYEFSYTIKRIDSNKEITELCLLSPLISISNVHEAICHCSSTYVICRHIENKVYMIYEDEKINCYKSVITKSKVGGILDEFFSTLVFDVVLFSYEDVYCFLNKEDKLVYYIYYKEGIGVEEARNTFLNPSILLNEIVDIGSGTYLTNNNEIKSNLGEHNMDNGEVNNEIEDTVVKDQEIIKTVKISYIKKLIDDKLEINTLENEITEENFEEQFKKLKEEAKKYKLLEIESIINFAFINNNESPLSIFITGKTNNTRFIEKVIKILTQKTEK
ncbi:hypothetical protein TCON_1751 [Astathelohania contejeani]|uniref:Uncharacterized protein n=1 Tax=Astathelohania contejeani TaxID=164912 RepID=A0ABQ7HXX3_9MICR|nr:hypothetical protein TCON_1751 [Thelohania contejeani]